MCPRDYTYVFACSYFCFADLALKSLCFNRSKRRRRKRTAKVTRRRPKNTSATVRLSPELRPRRQSPRTRLKPTRSRRNQ